MRPVHLAAMLLAVSFIPSVAQIEGPHVSLSPYAGAPVWASDIELDGGTLTGARAAGMLKPWLGLEGTYGLANTRTSFDGRYQTDVQHLGLDVVVNLLASRRVSPYLTGGWSQLRYDSDDANTVTGGTPYTFQGWEFGGGLNVALRKMRGSAIDLRLDARDVMTNLVQWFPDHEDRHHNLMVSAGLSFTFGRGPGDTDRDGIADLDDHCPQTPRLAQVDSYGCARDADCDGVYDGLDQCSDTPQGAIVSAEGCPIDTDGDGVFDGIDECTDTALGIPVTTSGCPMVLAAAPVEIAPAPPADTAPAVVATPEPTVPVPAPDTAHRAEAVVIRFKHASDWVDFGQRRRLDAVAKMLLADPALRLEVRGHADESGPEDINDNMARARAERVSEYIRGRYPAISAERLIVHGYGEYLPATDDTSEAGRAKNRRVEFRAL